jgi:hypothetical protein
MPSNQNPKLPSPKGGVFNDLTLRIKLILRLIADRRVNPLLKLLPLGAVIYLIFPDIIGPFDDALVLWLGSYLFVELCPPYVVQDHIATLNQVVPGSWRDPLENENEVIDAHFKDKS